MHSVIAPGTILLGKYRIERLLGEGGMGVVAGARHVVLDQPVAIKFLRPAILRNTQVVKRFLREARAAVRLKSEYVCQVFDVGTLDSGAPYMVMEFIEGMELGDLAARQQLAPGVVVDLLVQACAGLAEAHALGIVHRDIKPANLFVTTRPDGTLLLKVLDFGIATAPSEVDEKLTSTQAVLGTPAYMSPEQLRASRQVDARTDIWSLGVVLYELLAGRRPFLGKAFSELCLKVGMDPTPPLDSPVPAGLDVIVYRCLAKNPDERYRDLAALAAALAPYAQTRSAATNIVESTSRILGHGPISGVYPTGTFGRMATAPPVSTLTGSAAQLAPGEPSRRSGRRVGLLAGATLAVIVAGSSFAYLGDRVPGHQDEPDEIRSATDPAGTDALGTDALGADPLDTDALGADPLDTDALGADPLGADPAEAGPVEMTAIDAGRSAADAGPAETTTDEPSTGRSTGRISEQRARKRRKLRRVNKPASDRSGPDYFRSRR